MGLKEFVQNKIHEKHLKQYELEVARQKDAYQAFIDVMENNSSDKLITASEANRISPNVRFLPVETFSSFETVMDIKCKAIIFYYGEGLFSEGLASFVEKAFEEEPGLNIMYFDEDEIERDTGKRISPWFKPEFGIDSFLNYFSFGNIVAVREERLMAAYDPLSDNGAVNLYGRLLDIIVNDNKEPVHEAKVMFHRYVGENVDTTWREGSDTEGMKVLGLSLEAYNDVRRHAYKALGVEASFKTDKFGIPHAILPNENEDILIVIPSKDHSSILERCIKSIVTKSTYKNYSIVVVDNGSGDEEKEKYQKLSLEYGYSYIYNLMEFNFSKMCNMGAKSKESDYILFLNDDTEVITENWLEIMLGQARLPHAGAVGAKLYYPDGESLQHIGITNMTEGPSHKLQGHKDDKCVYHGVNRLDQNVIGVTGACLLASREKLEKIGFLNEELKVAYNDVYLCFDLYIKGYLNVIRNDAILLHHESLSRGDDHANQEKMIRLKKERMYLYSHFPMMYSVDPFYSMFLTGASNEYECILPFENRNIRPVNEIKLVTFPKYEVNETLIISVDRAETEKLWKDEPCVLIDLHSHVRGLDNSDYSFKMIIKSEDYAFEVPVIRRIRPDVIKVLYDELHVELSGFVARIPIKMLPKGEYEIYMVAKSLISRQVLINKADVNVTVEGE